MSIPVIIQRLFAKAITCSKKSLAFPVPNGKSEHAAQMLDAIITVLFVSMYNSLCVTIGSKMVPTLLQFFTKLEIVIDFSIKDNEDASIFIKNGLIPSR